MRVNKDTVLGVSFEEAQGQAKGAFDSLVKLRDQVNAKLAGSFDQVDKQPTGAFDLTKLETLKEQSSKNFFDKMSSLKQGKKTEGGAKQSPAGDDLLGVDFVGAPTPAPAFVAQPKTESKQQAAGDDLLGLGDFGAPKAPAPQSKQPASDFDLLDTQFQDLGVSKPEPKKQQAALDDDDFFSQGTKSTPKKQQQSNDDFMDLMGSQPSTAQSTFVNFDKPSAPTPPTNFLAEPSPRKDSFSKMANFTGLSDSKAKSKEAANKKGEKDPFDTIVF